MSFLAIAGARRRPSAFVLPGASYSHWRYLQTVITDAEDYSSTTLDDSAWRVGAAPFGDQSQNPNPGIAAHAYDPRFSTVIGTHADLDERIWIRRTLRLPFVPANGFIAIGYFDNSCRMFVNGALVLESSTDTNAGITQGIAASNFVIGDNIIAVQCDDFGVGGNASYFDFLFDLA